MALLVLIALTTAALPTATLSDDLAHDIPPLHGLAGAGWFYKQGCRLEAESMFDDSLRSFQAAVRLVHEEGRASGHEAGTELERLMLLIHNASWEVKVQDSARFVGLGSSDDVQIELFDSVGALPVHWQLGSDLRRVADQVCCVGREGASDVCFDFGTTADGTTPDDNLGGSEGEGSRDVAAAQTAGLSCSEHVHSRIEAAEHEFRDAARRDDDYRMEEGASEMRKRPPRYMPEALQDGYLNEVGAGLEYYYFDDSYASYYSYYGQEQLEALARLVRRRRPGTNYADVDRILYSLLDSSQTALPTERSLQEWMTGAAVVVVGSVVPWYEVLALQSGAAFTFTLEYNEVHYDDPRMLADIPDRYWRRRREAEAEQEQATSPEQEQATSPSARLGALEEVQRFDVGLSISSVEHAGLGRYGDPLDPRADLTAMLQLEEIIREDGLLVLAVPVGKDTVMWNAHRVYGRRRLTKLLERWTVQGVHGMRPEMLDRPVVPRAGEPQPVFLLRNMRPNHPANFSEFRDPVWGRIFETAPRP